MMICEFDAEVHLEGLRACVIELQDFERAFDARMPVGVDIVDEYTSYMLERCRRCDGTVLVASSGDDVAGFATVLTRVISKSPDDGEFEYGLVSDLVVAERFRGQGIGRMLLVEAEQHARACDVKWLRIGVLADNLAADGLYESMGYRRLYVEREKSLR